MADSNEQPEAEGGDLRAQLSSELQALQEANRLRTLVSPAKSLGVDFSSNDYLGFAAHSSLAEAAASAAHTYGSGGRASRLLSGGSPEHDSLEQLAAEWLAVEATLYFPSGYQANLGLIGSLAGRGDLIFSDELNHASIIDGARLSRARTTVYPHFDLAALERALANSRNARRRLVVTESVFSMDGDLAPLAELDRLCARYDAWLIVDEAHAVGLLGPEGAGACAALDHRFERLAAQLITGSKALGASGALVAGSRELCDVLINRARSFVFTTAPPPAAAAALAAAIDLVRESNEERERTLAHARRLADALALPAPAAAIIPFPASSEEHALEIQAKLATNGLDVRAIRPPTVPSGSSRLRIVCHASNSDAELEDLARLLRPEKAVQPDRAPKLAPRLFVTGTDTDVGKTVVSALVLRAAKRLGSSRYWKPVQTGPDSDTDEVARLAEVERSCLLPPAFHFPEPASPHTAARSAGREIPSGVLESSLNGIRRTLSGDQLIVELAGGLFVPLRDEFLQIDWLEQHAPPLVLVARSGLGTLNHTLLSLEALRKRHLEPRALFLVGEPHEANRTTLEALGGLAAIFEVPLFEELDTAALDTWLDQNPLDLLFS